MSEAALQEFVTAWKSGRVCLHPTDTLPGLSYDPRQESGWQSLLAIKQRAPDKSPIALIPSIEAAEDIWQALPGAWPQILRRLWPASLSVVWHGQSHAPSTLRAADGTVALRLPQLRDGWMQEALTKLGQAFPTSSVNHSGEAPCRSWEDAVAWVHAYHPEIYIPALGSASQSQKPSTLLRIIDAERWEILREGALPTSLITAEVQRHERNI